VKGRDGADVSSRESSDQGLKPISQGSRHG
jgi:hypothetical protein